MKKDNIKLNDGCIKLFKMLNLLYDDKAYYEDVVNIFKDDISTQSVNNLQVILNKNINTLKVFGVKIKKEGSKFRLDNGIYSLAYSLEDLKSISILLDTAKNFPDEEISGNLSDFIHNLVLRMNSGDRITLDNLAKNYDLTFYHAGLKEQIEKCRKICKENYILDIVYLHNKKENRIKCAAKDILYDSKTAYLYVVDLRKNEKLEIPLPDILSITKLPQIAGSPEITSTVVYKLKNRLAKTYKVKENEYAQGYDDSGNLIVVNKGEPFDHLLHRLMRYFYNCEILTPVSLRNKMIKLINETLNNYEK